MVDEAELLTRLDGMKELAKIPILDEKQKYTYVVRYTELLKVLREIKRGDEENGKSSDIPGG